MPLARILYCRPPRLDLHRDGSLLLEIAPGEFPMTSQGHDFLAVVRDGDMWAEAKGLAELLGGVPLRMLRDLALEAYHRNVMALANMKCETTQ
jgi:hypothetical protein